MPQCPLCVREAVPALGWLLRKEGLCPGSRGFQEHIVQSKAGLGPSAPGEAGVTGELSGEEQVPLALASLTVAAKEQGFPAILDSTGLWALGSGWHWLMRMEAGMEPQSLILPRC